MALTDKEKDAIRTLSAYFDTCNGECGNCDFPELHNCIPQRAKLATKRMRL